MKFLLSSAACLMVLPLFGFIDFCSLKNTTLTDGEVLELTVYYNLIGVYVNAGNATITTKLETVGGKEMYHITGEGRSNASYEWIFRVRDYYQSYVDKATLRVTRFVRNIEEGGFKKREDVYFDHVNHTAKTADGTFRMPDCVQDIVTTFSQVRNIDFDQLPIGEKIPFNLFIDNQIYRLYIRYMGKEEVTTQYGKFKAIRIKPLLLKGSMFEGGENMNLWLSDDKNRLPLRVETAIVVGKIKVDMMNYRNIPYPLTSLISR